MNCCNFFVSWEKVWSMTNGQKQIREINCMPTLCLSGHWQLLTITPIAPSNLDTKILLPEMNCIGWTIDCIGWTAIDFQTWNADVCVCVWLVLIIKSQKRCMILSSRILYYTTILLYYTVYYTVYTTPLALYYESARAAPAPWNFLPELQISPEGRGSWIWTWQSVSFSSISDCKWAGRLEGCEIASHREENSWESRWVGFCPSSGGRKAL